MKNRIVVIRIDPDRRAIARMTLKAGNSATKEVCRLLRAKSAAARVLLDVDGVHLMVAARAEVDDEMKGWRLLGSEDTAGVGLLYGGAQNAMVDVPVDLAWVEQRIVWMEAEAVEDRAADLLPALDSKARRALFQAVTEEAGAGSPVSPLHGEDDLIALINLGLLKSDRSAVTRTGRAVFDLMEKEEA